MSNDVLTFSQQDLRGTDSNSLLRRYDLANKIFNKSDSQQEQAKAGRAIERMASELRKRDVPL